MSDKFAESDKPAGQSDRLAKSDKLAEQIGSLVANMVAPANASHDGFVAGPADTVDNVMWVDFTEVKYALEPTPAAPPATNTPQAQLTPEEIGQLIIIEQRGADTRDYAGFYQQLKQSVFNGLWPRAVPRDNYGITNLSVDAANGVVTYDEQNGFGNVVRTVTIDVRATVNEVMLRLPVDYAADFADSYYGISDLSSSDAYFRKQGFLQKIELFWGSPAVYLHYVPNQSWQWYMDNRVPTYWSTLREQLVAAFGEGQQELSGGLDKYKYVPAPVQPKYPFLTFVPGEANLGLRLVYRQEWRPLGVQRGEVIRTIPLGPKQVEKVSTSITRRTKVSKTAENLKSTESTTETTDTTKTSSEVVDEASKSMKWNVNQDVEGGFNAGVWHIGGKTDIGVSQESRESSRDTSTRLTETMKKIANRLRTESKVVVSTESETTFQTTSATEIQNPNDEIAVTYVFRRLQQQYEVLTWLAEIQNVVMIAEPLPAPEAVNFTWTKQHDWIIAKVLLDDSFRDALTSISQDSGFADTAELVLDLKDARDKTLDHLGKFATNSQNLTATNIDIATQSQENYRQTLEQRIERLKQNYDLEAKRDRLYMHLRENILHYYRAIWSEEDPQQRLLRYRAMGVQVPIDWHAETESTDLVQAITSSPPIMPVSYVADTNSRTVDFADLINPAGPIGYFGNYAVYYMRPEYAVNDSFSFLGTFKQPYMYAAQGAEPILMDPFQIELEAKYAAALPDQATINRDAQEMISYVPELRVRYQIAQSKGDQAVAALLGDLALFQRYYAEYQFRKEQSRRFVVDTNNLVVDIITGEGSALESFKNVHRGIDVLKALGERTKLFLENERLEDRLSATPPNLEDPDTERVIVVAGDVKAVAAAAAGEEARK